MESWSLETCPHATCYHASGSMHGHACSKGQKDRRRVTDKHLCIYLVNTKKTKLWKISDNISIKTLAEIKKK